MSVTLETVAKIAKLSRISLSGEEAGKMQGEINQLLSWIDKLQSVNTEGVEIMSGGTAAALPMREDKITDGGCRDDILANAPESDFGCFIVPKVIE